MGTEQEQSEKTRWSAFQRICAVLGAFILFFVGYYVYKTLTKEVSVSDNPAFKRLREEELEEERMETMSKRARAIRDAEATAEMEAMEAPEVAVGDIVYVKKRVPGFDERRKVCRYWAEEAYDARRYWESCAECGSATLLYAAEDYEVVEVKSPLVCLRKQGDDAAWWTAGCWVSKTVEFAAGDVVRVVKCIPGFGSTDKVRKYHEKDEEEAKDYLRALVSEHAASYLFTSDLYKVEAKKGDLIYVRALGKDKSWWVEKRFVRKSD